MGSFPGGSDDKEYTCNVGDLDLIPGLRRSPGEGHGNPLQYSCLGNLVERGAFSSVQFSCSVVSHSLWPHGLQQTRPPCPSPTPGVYSSSCPLSQWCHPTISSSVVPFSSRLQSFPASGSFQWVSSSLPIRGPKYWSFSFIISPSNEYSGLISLKIDWLNLIAVQGAQESSPTSQFKSINYLLLSFLYCPTLTAIQCSPWGR